MTLLFLGRTFDNHLAHLQKGFYRLKQFNITLSPKKCFLAYPSIALLGQKVNALGLASATDQLSAIQTLAFPRTLKQLEYYLDLTGYIRQYIPHYAKLSAALPNKKCELNRLLRKGENDEITKAKRRRKAVTTNIRNVTIEEKNSFDALQLAFKNSSILNHLNPDKKLYVDTDTSKDGISGIVYHSTFDPPSQKSVLPIKFLSRLITSVEKNYWPTELEIACLCWIIARIRHLIESAKFPTIVYIDHSSSRHTNFHGHIVLSTTKSAASTKLRIPF